MGEEFESRSCDEKPIREEEHHGSRKQDCGTQ